MVAPDLGIVRQGLDNTANLMYNYTIRQLQEKYQGLKALAGRLRLMSPSIMISNSQNTLEHLARRFETAFSASVEEKRQTFIKISRGIEALSPLKVLTRGYSITFENSRILSSVKI